MASSATAAPGTRPPPTARSRRSVFIEAPMEYTPAQSTYERSIREPGRWSWSEIYERRWAKVALRVINGVVHAAACALLLSIMTEFLYRYRGREQRPPAIALTSLVATDISLDIYAVSRAKTKWQALALILRLLCGLGYIAMFLVYVGFREVFPQGYSYWGMSSGFSDPVVYLFLWLERGIDTEATIALGEIHSGEKNSTQLEAMSRSGSSSTSGDSSYQRTTSPGNPESKTMSAVTSRRTSTVLSEDTLDGEGGGEAYVAPEEFKT
ncbi:hypothetical protein F5883DRAFT_645258 [Diaporthe sp. PMI_573]|nr:hypothetical protein F5883DRAFT_645258 [Diaporthaceae sp. PMI_573]